MYDNKKFFEAYGKLGRSVHGLKAAREWTSLRVMLPNINGLKVVDLGCGYGWFCRWARENGASRVDGYDISEKMLMKAKSMTTDPAIHYHRDDLETLVLPEAAFDLVYSSLTLHYIKNLSDLFNRIYRALTPGGHFVFSVEHPIFMAPQNPGWKIARRGNKTWPIDHYFLEGKRVTDWLAKGVVKYHRTMGTTLNLLIQTGFTIKHVEEFCPTKAHIAARPELAEEVERPMFLLVGVQR